MRLTSRGGGEGMAKEKQKLFVLLAGPQQQVAPGTCYIAQDGYTTMIRLKAARFYRFAEAKGFANEHHIKFNAHTYVSLEEFTDVEIHG